MKRFSQKFAHFAAGKLLLIHVGVFIAIRFLLPLGGSGLAMITDTLVPINSNLIIEQTNAKRAAMHLSALVHNPSLDQAAQDKLASMEKDGYFGHVSPDGRMPWDFIRARGYSYQAAGENLAKGFTDPSSLVAAWMNSPPHYANITSPHYIDIGVAQKKILVDGFPTVVVVQMFGSPSPTTPAGVVVASVATVHQAQRVSTITKIAPVPAPIQIVASRKVESALSLYLTAMLGALILALAVIEFRRPAWVALAGNAALLALAVAIPLMPTVTQIIF